MTARAATVHGSLFAMTAGIRVLAVFLLLAGCATDNYTVMRGGKGSQERLNDDLWACRHQVINQHMIDQGGPFGIFTGGDKNDLNVKMEECMKAKGYTGTTQHFN